MGVYEANLKRVGGSVMLAIPPAVLQLLDFKVNTAVDLTVEDGHLVVERKRKRYKLQDLINQCDLTAPFPARDVEWENAPAAGVELLG